MPKLEPCILSDKGSSTKRREAASNYSIICVTLNTELNTVDKRRFGAQTAV